MLDSVIDSWILWAQTSTCSVGVFTFRESENSKEDSRLLRSEKYKTYHKRTLLTFVEEKVNLFLYLVKEVRKRLNYHLPNSPSKAAYSLSFTSVKEGKNTWKDPFDYEKWGLQQ